MKNLSTVVAAALLALSIGGNAGADMTIKTVTSEQQKPVVTKEKYQTVIATIEAIDLKTRVVTLKSQLGRVFDVKVIPQAKNLPQLRKGDQVTVKYHEAVTAKVYRAGEAPSVTERSASLDLAKEGAQPGGKLAVQSTVTATIETIDTKKPSVTLKSLDGKSLTVKVEDPKILENVKVGDEVVITYTEALAVSVEKAKKTGKKK
ncbi:MAG TPA: hypothetical protein VIU41_06510 [Geobacteraceae bacterium]